MTRISASHAAVSGMLAAQRRLEVSAGNVANVSTPGYVPARTTDRARREGGVESIVEREPSATGLPATRPDAPAGVDGDGRPLSGTDLGTEFVTQITAQRAFEANLAVLRTENEMLGSLVRRRG